MTDQEYFTLCNSKIISALKTASAVLDGVDSEDPIYADLISSYSLMLRGMIDNLEAIDKMRFPLYPGKYLDLVLDAKRRMADDSSTDYRDLLEILHEEGLSYDSANDALQFLARDPEVELLNDMFILKKDAVRWGEGYRDGSTGKLDRDKVEAHAREVAAYHVLTISHVGVDSPLSNEVNVELTPDTNVKLFNVLMFRQRLICDLGVNVSVVFQTTYNEDHDCGWNLFSIGR